MKRVLKLLIALTPPGAAALLAGGGTFSSFAALDEWVLSRPVRERNTATPGKTPSAAKTKKILLAVMAIGAAAYLGTGGTFATFSAETSNSGDAIASGTLTMSDAVSSGTICYSSDGTVNYNPPGCSKVINVDNLAPGVFNATMTSQVTIANTGSLDASSFYLYAPYSNSKLTTAFTDNSATTRSLAVAALEGSITSGDTIRLSNGATTQDFIAAANAAGAATSISITGLNTGKVFGIGTLVTDVSSDSSPTNTDCYDATTTTPGGGVVGATTGSSLTGLVSATGNPLCKTLVMWVQETTGTGQHYCWYGDGQATAACTAPLSVTTSAAATCASTSLSVNALNGNVKPGDTISVASGATTCTFTTASTVGSPTFYVGATSLTGLTPVTGGSTALPSGSFVSNTSALGRLNSFSTNTISNFDTTYNAGGWIHLKPVQTDGNLSTTATTQLTHAGGTLATRTFQIGFYMPSPNGQNQSALQGLSSTFGLSFHIEQ